MTVTGATWGTETLMGTGGAAAQGEDLHELLQCALEGVLVSAQARYTAKLPCRYRMWNVWKHLKYIDACQVCACEST